MIRSLTWMFLMAGGAIPALAQGPEPAAVPVPGGMAAVARLLGPVSQGPEQFLYSVNRVLLSRITAGHDWQEVEARARLVEYLDDMDRLQNKLSMPLTLKAEPPPARKQFARLAGELGYRVKLKGGTIEVLPKDGDAAERGRRLARALEWDLIDFGRRLAEGETVTLELPVEFVPSPWPWDVWAGIVGREVSRRKALRELATDQRLGLVMEGWRRLAPELRALLAKEDLRWLYREGSSPFYRYAAAFEMVGGSLRVPGGNSARSRWSDLTGESPERPVALLRRLLLGNGGRGAYFWHALFFASREAQTLFLGLSPSTTERLSRKLFRSLDDEVQVAFDSPYNPGLGFAALARALPVGSDGTLPLPGGPGVWFQAMKRASIPSGSSELDRLVDRAEERELDAGEFLVRVLNESVDYDGVQRPVLPRLIRTANLFPEHRELLEAANVVMLARLSDSAPAALSVFDGLTVRQPTPVREYLLTVAGLRELSQSFDTELLVINFQGGVEWLRHLALAGKTPPEVVTEELEAWSRLHRDATDPWEAAPDQVEWIAGLVSKLPQPPADAPGRGPAERALLAAVIPFEDPQEFEWRGLSYRGTRGRTLAAAMVGRLERQGIPPVDTFLEMRQGFQAMRAACRRRDVERLETLATELRGIVASLSDFKPADPKGDSRLRERVYPIDREELLRLLDRLRQRKKSRKLDRALRWIDEAEERLGRELRQLFLGFLYAVAIGDSRHPLFDDPDLARKHLLVDDLAEGVPDDRSWREAELVGGDTDLGAHLVGHLSGIANALGEIRLLQRAGGASFEESKIARAQIWYRNLHTIPWRRLNRDVLGTAALAYELGSIRVDSYVSEPDPAGPLPGHVPLARLHGNRGGQGPLVSVSERVLVGLELLTEVGESDLPPVHRKELLRHRQRLGADWRRELNVLGAPTPALNGRHQAWLGDLPPYEALDRDRHLEALFERESLDFSLAVWTFLGREGLPAELGADLIPALLRDAAADLTLETGRDWEGVLDWIEKRDDGYFEDLMTECLKQGLYTAQF